MGNENGLSAAIGRNIRRFRNERRLGQHELAKLLSVTQPTVSSWETGEHTPHIDVLSAVAKVLHCTLAELVSE